MCASRYKQEALWAPEAQQAKLFIHWKLCVKTCLETVGRRRLELYCNSPSIATFKVGFIGWNESESFTALKYPGIDNYSWRRTCNHSGWNKVSTSSISKPWASAPDTIFIKTALSNLKFFLNKQCGQVITTTSDVTSAERHYISIIQEHGTTKGSACSWRQSETMEIDLSSRTRQIARNSTHPVNPRTFQSILRCRNVFYIIVDINVWFNGKRLSNLSIMIRLIRRLSSRRIFGIL